MGIQISVIMPVYNAAEFLEETLDSIFAQTFTEFELIAIDDGSTDSSRSILQKYESGYPQMHVFTQDNQGPSAARNNGLQKAAGKYIYFFDADDILSANALKLLYDRMEKEQADLVIAKYDVFDERRTYRVTNIDGIVRLNHILWDNPEILWTYSCSNKLFRNDRIREWKLRFPALSYSEDAAFVIQYVFLAQRICGLNAVVFHYRRMRLTQKVSITSGADKEKVTDFLNAHRIIFHALQKKAAREYPQYRSFKDICQNEGSVKRYVNELIKKEVTILLNQFYRPFWNEDKSVSHMIALAVKDLMGQMSQETCVQVQKQHPDLTLPAVPTDWPEAEKQVKITVILYGTTDEIPLILKCLQSIAVQSLFLINIIIPKYDYETEALSVLHDPRVQMLNADQKDRFISDALKRMHTPYVIFADPYLRYEKAAFLWLYKKMMNQPCAAVGSAVIFRSGKNNQTKLQRIRQYGKGIGFLCKKWEILGNKIFNVLELKQELLQSIFLNGRSHRAIGHKKMKYVRQRIIFLELGDME